MFFSEHLNRWGLHTQPYKKSVIINVVNAAKYHFDILRAVKALCPEPLVQQTNPTKYMSLFLHQSTHYSYTEYITSWRRIPSIEALNANFASTLDVLMIASTLTVIGVT